MTACSAAVLLVDDDIIVRHPLTEYCANAASLFLRRRTEMMAGCSDSIPASPGAVANMLVYRNRKSAGKRVVWVSASLLSLVS
jgi:hypothetical protein